MKLRKDDNAAKITERHEAELSLIINLMAIPAVLRAVRYTKRALGEHTVKDGDSKETAKGMDLSSFIAAVAKATEHMTEGEEKRTPQTKNN